MSYMDSEYSIKSIQETLEYISNGVLFKRLVDMTELLLKIKHNDIKEVMWYPDDLKLRSCMTLFYAITGNKIFQKVIEKFYEGEKDLKTIMILKGMLEKEKNKLTDKTSKILEKNLNLIEKEEKIKLEKKKEEEKKIRREKEKEKEKEREREREREIEKEKEKEREKEKEKEKERKYVQKTLDEFIYQKKVVDKNNQKDLTNKIDNQKDGSVLNIDNNMAYPDLYNQEHMNLGNNYIDNKNKLITNEDNKNGEKENSNLKKEIKEPKNSIRK